MARYKTKAEYFTAIRALYQRASRSGWNIRTASRDQLAAWLLVPNTTLATLNREYGISLDDIRTGRLSSQTEGADLR